MVMLAAMAWAQKPEEAMALNERGRAASAALDYATAEKLYRQSAAMWITLGPAYEAHLSVEYFNLAEALCGQGKWREGQGIFEQSLTLGKRALGPTHIRTLTESNALAHVYMMLGELDRSEVMLREMLPVERELYPSDLQLAHTLAALGSIRLRTGRIDEALAPAEEALAIALKAGGEDSEDAATMYQNVAQIHRAARRPDRALPLFRKARAIMDRIAGPRDPRYAALLSQEGLALMDDGKLAQAGRELKQAVSLLQACPACSLELATAEGNLGLLRMRQKKYSEASDLLAKSLTIQEAYAPEDSMQIGNTRRALDALRRVLR
jgi:tetratricopeptide (TPR) repeat protein